MTMSQFEPAKDALWMAVAYGMDWFWWAYEQFTKQWALGWQGQSPVHQVIIVATVVVVALIFAYFWKSTVKYVPKLFGAVGEVISGTFSGLFYFFALLLQIVGAIVAVFIALRLMELF